MKTLYVLLAIVSWSAAFAAPRDGLLERFAQCSGRLSAQVEHFRLMRDPRADDAERARDAMVELLNSIPLKHEDEVRAMSLRLDAKVAHAGLLARATFYPEEIDALWAAQRADALAEECVSLVLSSPTDRSRTRHSLDPMN